MIKLDKRCFKNLPEGYQFENSAWHKALIENEKQEKLRFSLEIQIILILFGFVGIGYNLLNFDKLNLIISGVYTAITLMTLIYTFIKKDVTIAMGSLFTIFYIVFLGLLFWDNEQIKYSSFFYLIQILFLMTTVLSTWIWRILFLLESVILGVGIYFGYTPIEYPVVNRAEVILPVAAILVFIAFKRLANRKNVLIDDIVYDITTKLPKREILLDTKIKKESLLCLLKVSNFRDLLNSFGYDLADEIFGFSAKKMHELVKNHNYMCYKLLGNEYAILLPIDEEHDEINLRNKLSQMLHELEEEKMKWRGTEIGLNYHLGAALIRVNDDTIKSTISKADIALKEGEKTYSKIVIYNEALHSYLNPIEAIIKFSTLIENKEENKFLAEFFPVIDMKTKEEKFYECFTKIKSRDGKVRSILEYSDIAKATGMYRDITFFALQEAAKFAEKNGVDVSINICAKDLTDFEVMSKVRETKEQIRNVCGKKLYIEISEREKYNYNESIQNFMEKGGLSESEVVLDNFGENFFSLENILGFPGKLIKVESELVEKAMEDLSVKELLKGLILFCKKLETKVIAEGLDNEESYLAAIQFDFDMLQGEYLKK